MRNFIAQHVQIFFPILLLSYANIVLKWQVNKLPSLTESGSIFQFILNLLMNVWMLSVLVAVSVAGISWLVALKNFDISYAYPFVSLSFLFVTTAGIVLLGEKFSPMAFLGLLFIVVGVGLTAKSGFHE